MNIFALPRFMRASCIGVGWLDQTILFLHMIAPAFGFKPSRTKHFTVKTIIGPLTFMYYDVRNLLTGVYDDEYQIDTFAEDGVIVDVGAANGIIARCLIANNPTKQVYCFEPLDQMANMLDLNAPEAIREKFCLGDRDGVIKLGVDEKHLMASFVETLDLKYYPETFVVKRFDTYAEEKKITEVCFMKIDVEGMEVQVLDGMGKLLEKTHRLAIETHSFELHGKVKSILIFNKFNVFFEKKPAKFNGCGLLIARR